MTLVRLHHHAAVAQLFSLRPPCWKMADRGGHAGPESVRWLPTGLKYMRQSWTLSMCRSGRNCDSRKRRMQGRTSRHGMISRPACRYKMCIVWNQCCGAKQVFRSHSRAFCLELKPTFLILTCSLWQSFWRNTLSLAVLRSLSPSEPRFFGWNRRRYIFFRFSGQNLGYWSFYLFKYRFFKCFESNSVFWSRSRSEPSFWRWCWSQHFSPGSQKKNIWRRSRGKMAWLRNTGA